jgi:hypothetical protein
MSAESAVVIIGIAFVGGLFGLIMGANYLYEKNIGCPRFAANVERPYKYDFFGGGCFVQTTTGQWVAYKNYWNNPVIDGSAK